MELNCARGRLNRMAVNKRSLRKFTSLVYREERCACNLFLYLCRVQVRLHISVMLLAIASKCRSEGNSLQGKHVHS